MKTIFRTNVFKCEKCGVMSLRAFDIMRHEKRCKPENKDYIKNKIYGVINESNK